MSEQPAIGFRVTTSGAPVQRIAITGATGFLGSHLSRTLSAEGHRVVPISRQQLPEGIQWHPEQGVLDAAALEGMDAIIHLAGEGLADRRWSETRKLRIRRSRTDPTELLARTLASLERPPAVLVSMSAVGYYGDAGDQVLTEDSPAGSDFLARTCLAWEAAADPAGAAGIRVVHPRTGVVLSTAGGALPRMLFPFRLGIAGRLGSGRQWMSWIALTDAVAGIRHCMMDPRLDGPVNLSSPQPVTNATFTRSLARVLRRPAIIPVPALLLRVVFGELAEATLLAGQRAVPRRLEATGFEFAYPLLDAALQHLLPRDQTTGS